VVASAALLGAFAATPASGAEPVSPRAVDALLELLDTGPVAYERAVVVDLRTAGVPFVEARLHDRYTELVRRENDERARTEYRGAASPRTFALTGYDGRALLEVPRGRGRRTAAAPPEILRRLARFPIHAAAIAGIDETPGADGSRRLHVRLEGANPRRLVGDHLDEVLSVEVGRAIRSGTESLDVVLAPDGRLSRVAHRLRLAVDGAVLMPFGARLGPHGVVRIRISAITRILPEAAGILVARPGSADGPVDDEQIRLFREPTAVGPRRLDPGARPSGDRSAIRLARRANAAFRGDSEIEIGLRPAIPGSSISLRARVRVRDGIVRGQRVTLDGEVGIVETPEADFVLDEPGGCWRRDPAAPGGIPFVPFEVGRAPIALRGARFFAPEPRGRTVRIVAERTVGGTRDRVRYTLSRSTGRLLVVETVLHRGRVIARPGLTVGVPAPVC
jgi:hypothetical protein